MNQEKPTSETPPKMPDGHHGHQHEHASHDHGKHHQGDPGGTQHAHHAHMVEDFKKRFWISLVLTIPILLLSPLIQRFLGLEEAIGFPGDLIVLFALSSLVFFYGGWPFLKGIYLELSTREPGMMTLIAVAITTAYVYSSAVVFGLAGKMFFWELATLIDVMLLGHWIEMRSVMGASRALEELAKLMPSEAHKILPDGSVQDVPLSELQSDDQVLVKPGEKVPADGDVVRGQSSVNEAMLTGESVPVSKSVAATVIGGSINGEGSITIIIRKMGAESFLSQVIDLVREAQESKSATQDLANRAAVWLTVVALGGGQVRFLDFAGVGGGLDTEQFVVVELLEMIALRRDFPLQGFSLGRRGAGGLGFALLGGGGRDGAFRRLHQDLDLGDLLSRRLAR